MLKKLILTLRIGVVSCLALTAFAVPKILTDKMTSAWGYNHSGHVIINTTFWSTNMGFWVMQTNGTLIINVSAQSYDFLWKTNAAGAIVLK